MAYHSVENVLAIDSKLFVTMKYLLFRPGKLTKEYINGKIVRYVHPSKLFWFVSILFFAVLTTILSEENDNKQQKSTQVASTITETETVNDIIQSKITENNNIPTNETTENASKKKDSGKKKKNTTSQNDNNLVQGYKFKNSFMSYAPYASFLLIPFFAFLLNLFFRKKEMFYADHLTFALHFHTFVFILFLIYILINNLFPDNESEVYIFMVIPLVYFAWALWTVYRPKISTLLFKMSAIFIVYGIAIISTVVLLFIIAIKLSGIDIYSHL
ncbi:MAG: DUF3667 domain-containing protein [Tannerella sp.]|jgi:hypothetical protein|nr:DUF3667 domain-containing protein [Tannerella sp.]